jgi:eukaryotic-like serine/threonine-protein kinase
MGEVYAARDEVLRRDVAVKLLATRWCEDETMRERFVREATLAASLGGHPHVVAVHDAGTWQGRPYFVMELAAGSVADRLRAGLPELRWSLVWLAQAADALDAAHLRGIVHRDVKPANLLVDEYGAIRVSDFGIARDAEGTLTGSGEVLGTAGYLAPEQARGDRCTAASDCYSLAVVARELLTGARDGRVAPAAEAIFARTLAEDPSVRPAVASAFVQELEKALAPPAPSRATAVLRTPLPAAKRARRPPRRRLKRVGALLGTLVLVAAAALGGYAVAVAPEQDPAARAARPTTCTASPAGHDANVVVRGVRARVYCTRLVRVLAGTGEAWSYRNGRRLLAPDNGATEVTLVCRLQDRRVRLDVYDSGSQRIGRDFCTGWVGSNVA